MVFQCVAQRPPPALNRLKLRPWKMSRMGEEVPEWIDFLSAHMEFKMVQKPFNKLSYYFINSLVLPDIPCIGVKDFMYHKINFTTYFTTYFKKCEYTRFLGF